jgi:hypothetical protein
MDTNPKAETLKFRPFCHADIQREAAIYLPPPPARWNVATEYLYVVKQAERGAISHIQHRDLTSM